MDSAAYYYNKAFEHVDKISVDEWSRNELIANYNAAERHLWEYDIDNVMLYIDSCKKWFNASDKPLTTWQDEINKATLSLELLCTMYREHRKGKELKFEDIKKLSDSVIVLKLLESDYCRDMVYLMDQILRTQFDYFNNETQFKHYLDHLQWEVRTMAKRWATERVSRPAIILKKMEQAILKADSTSYPKL